MDFSDVYSLGSYTINNGFLSIIMVIFLLTQTEYIMKKYITDTMLQ